MRRKDDTLRDNLLGYARNIAATKGIDAINIRSIAQEAGVAAGTVYNYFSNKEEILLALTEESWKESLQDMNAAITADSFCGQLEEIFIYLRERINGSAGPLMRSLGNLETTGQERMNSMQQLLEKSLLLLMEQDTEIRKDIWNETFTKEQYIRFIMRNFLMMLKSSPSDYHFFMELINRTIYSREQI